MRHPAVAATVDAASIPAGHRLYVIGDVHGRSDLLDALANIIEKDAAASLGPETGCIFLGDYIDRGPHSKKVLDRLAAQDWPLPFLALRGNHEEMLLRFLTDASYLSAWQRYGGLETLYSYGIDVQKVMKAQAFDSAQEALLAAMPQEVVDFVAATPNSYMLGDYFFCHAGIRPGIALAEQREEDLLWIREEFVDSTAEHEKVIVHGHTPAERPEVKLNRINVDTGAYITGTLTCLVLEADQQRFLMT
jgi:predicted MPP superfamily phosphohydrolase